MKTITRLFLVGLIALGMTACSNEDEVKLEGQPESTVSVRVVPSSNGPVTYATGDLSGVGITAPGLAAESAIKTLEVYLFDDLQGGKQVGYKIGLGDNVTEVKDIETTSGPKTIVVVANCSIIGEVTKKDDLLAKTRDLPVGIVNGLPMTGMTAEPVVVKPGYNHYGSFVEPTGGEESNEISSTSLPLTRINARVAITKAEIALTTHSDFFDGLTAVEVAMFNVPKTSKLFGETLVTSNPAFLHGAQWVSTAGTYTIGEDNSAFLDGVTSAIVFPITLAAAPYYYVNEHTPLAENDKMMIVLRGKPTKGQTPVEAEGLYTTGGYTYYPVWVNIDGTITGNDGVKDGKILRNTQYNISLTIKGIGNPTIDPPAESWLDVAVEVAPWLVVTQNVEWNTPTAP